MTNCLTESEYLCDINEEIYLIYAQVMFEEARTTAKSLDDEFAATKKLRGPLHGVPVSIKDHCE